MSNAETEVIRALWELSSATTREVSDALRKNRRRWDFSTVQTYLARLEDKGYVKSRLEGRTKVFTAKASPRVVVREVIDEFVKRMFDGDCYPLMQHLIQHRGLDADALTKLKELMDQVGSDT